MTPSGAFYDNVFPCWMGVITKFRRPGGTKTQGRVFQFCERILGGMEHLMPIRELAQPKCCFFYGHFNKLSLASRFLVQSSVTNDGVGALGGGASQRSTDKTHRQSTSYCYSALIVDNFLWILLGCETSTRDVLVMIVIGSNSIFIVSPCIKK